MKICKILPFLFMFCGFVLAQTASRVDFITSDYWSYRLSGEDCIWLANSHELTRFDKNTKEFERIEFFDRGFDCVMFDRIKGIDLDPGGNLWLNTNVGAIKYDGEFTKLYDRDGEGIFSNRIREIKAAGDGKVYLAHELELISSTEVVLGLTVIESGTVNIYEKHYPRVGEEFDMIVEFDREDKPWFRVCEFTYEVSFVDRIYPMQSQHSSDQVWGLLKFDGDGWEEYSTSNYRLPNDYVGEFTFDTDNSLICYFSDDFSVGFDRGHYWDIRKDAIINPRYYNELTFFECDVFGNLWMQKHEFGYSGGMGGDVWYYNVTTDFFRYDGETWTEHFDENAVPYFMSWEIAVFGHSKKLYVFNETKIDSIDLPNASCYPIEKIGERYLMTSSKGFAKPAVNSGDYNYTVHGILEPTDEDYVFYSPEAAELNNPNFIFPSLDSNLYIVGNDINRYKYSEPGETDTYVINAYFSDFEWVREVMAGAIGDIWMGSSQGLKLFFFEDEKLTCKIYDDDIYEEAKLIGCDRSGNVYFYDSHYSYKMKDGYIDYFSSPPGSLGYGSEFDCLSDGTIYLLSGFRYAGNSEYGINIAKVSGDEIKHKDLTISNVSGITDEVLAIDSVGTVWFSARETGLDDELTSGMLPGRGLGVYCFDGSEFEAKNLGLPKCYVNDLAVDPTGTVWAATSRGLGRFDGERWRMYSSCNSDLPGNYLNEIKFDAFGNAVIKWNGNNISLINLDDIVGVEDYSDQLGELSFSVSPNPTSGSLRINFELPQSGLISLNVYDLFGREVATLVEEFREAGEHEARFEAAGLPSGVYLIELRAGGDVVWEKMILAR